MASATQHRGAGAALLLPAVLLLALSMATTLAAAADAGSCADDKLPANRTFAHCAALGPLGATLHWTYDTKTALLSLAFVAPTPGANGTGGWVSWALNPTGDGMKGAQALLALKRGNPPAYVVNTYNLTSYRALGGDSTPIMYKATDLAADESDGKVRLYGKLQLHQGMEVVNHIWGVGSTVTDGAPVKHALAQENLDAKGKLVLSGSVLGPAPEPAPAPGHDGSSPKNSSRGGDAPAPSPSGSTDAGSCADDKLPANRTYAHCAALGPLGATLHWTYDAKTALLSLAFVAPTPGANGTGGWVSWALNPTGTGMKGAQALLALKRGNPPAYVVNTYNLTGYGALGGDSTPIMYKATDLAADESGGKVRLYGTLQLHQGMDVVNHIWNVGPTGTDGAPVKHAFAQENLDAKGRLALSGSVLGPVPEPAPAPGHGDGGAAPAPSGSTELTGDAAAAAAATYVSAPVLMLLAFAGFLAIA